MDLQRMRAQEFPVIEEWRCFTHRARAQLTSRWQAQRCVLSVCDRRLGLSAHFYNTIDTIDAVLEALP
jgi:hypothetical protein